MRRFFLSLLAIGGALVLLAQDTPPSTPAPTTPAPSEISPPTTNTNLVDAETRELKPGDEFSFRIEEDPVKSSDPMRVVATELGDAYFRVTRMSDKSVTVNVRNKRLADVRREVQDRLEKDFYRKATVALDLVGIAGQNSTFGSSLVGKAIFFGEIRATLPLPEGEKVTLSEAILRLGGGSNFANLKKVRVNRRDPDTGKMKTLVIDVDAIIYKNQVSEDIELKDGDRIEIPSKKFVL